MAKEIKSFTCHPDYEQEVIDFRRKVGWEFISTQEIYNKDTHMEGGFFTNTITSITETTHYVKITFQRDRDKVNPELLSLERQIDDSHAPKEPRTWGGLALALGFGMWILPGIFMLSSNKKKKDAYQIELEQWREEFSGLMARVDALQ